MITYCDEQQRNYVLTSILMTSYFDCRSIFMFDIKSRFASKNHVCNSFDYITIVDKSKNENENSKTQNIENNMNWNDNWVMFINSNEEFASHVDKSTYWENDSDNDIDDNVDAGLNEIESLFWRHIIFIIAFNRVFEKSNILFVKMTITHTKKKNNRFRK